MRWLNRLLLFLFLLLLFLAATGVFLTRNSFPKVDGEITVGSLKAPVKILRDEHGIPNIYASTQEDLFFAQGYVHAQDRFWQMDFWRHTGAGRLSELFGPSQVQTDRVLRTMGWARVVEEELKHTDPVSLSILQSYSAGINAYLREHSGSELSLEHVVLGLMNRGYTAEPWKPAHSVTWGKAMSWDLGSNMASEIQRSIMLKTIPTDRL